MTTQRFCNNLLFTTQLFKMEQICTFICSFTLNQQFFMRNLKNIQEFSRTPENIQGHQDVFQESRT